MAISFGSINTGLPKDIVQQIMKAENIPIEKMEARKGNFAEKKKLVEELETLLRDLQGVLADNQSSRSFRELKPSFNNDLVEVTVDKNVAGLGNHQFEIVQLARKSSMMSSGFEDPNDSYLGVGYIQYYSKDKGWKDVYIDASNSSLNGVARVINNTPDFNATATVVNDGVDPDRPWRIIMSLKDTGDNDMAEWPYFYFVDGDDDLYLDFERPAQDAKVKFDGFELEFDNNKIKDLIPGVTIDLKKAKPGEEFTIGIGEDIQKTVEKLKDLIEKINAVLKFVNDQNKLDGNSNTFKTLGGDISIQTIEQRLRRVIITPVQTSTGPLRFSNLGVVFQKDGLLRLDERDLEAQIAKDPFLVSEFFTGFINNDDIRVNGLLNDLLDFADDVLQLPFGIIPNRKKGIQSKVNQIDRQIEQRQRILDQREKMLKQKFSQLESTINRIRGQGNGLAALTQNLPTNPIQQLG